MKNRDFCHKCYPYADEPSKPGRPNIEDWGPHHCDLSWKPPASDGGAPITHYEIEYMVSVHNCVGFFWETNFLHMQKTRHSGANLNYEMGEMN